MLTKQNKKYWIAIYYLLLVFIQHFKGILLFFPLLLPFYRWGNRASVSLGEMDFLCLPISTLHRCSTSICWIEEHSLLYLFLYLIFKLMVEPIFVFWEKCTPWKRASGNANSPHAVLGNDKQMEICTHVIKNRKYKPMCRTMIYGHIHLPWKLTLDCSSFDYQAGVSTQSICLWAPRFSGLMN